MQLLRGPGTVLDSTGWTKASEGDGVVDHQYVSWQKRVVQDVCFKRRRGSAMQTICDAATYAFDPDSLFRRTKGLRVEFISKKVAGKALVAVEEVGKGKDGLWHWKVELSSCIANWTLERLPSQGFTFGKQEFSLGTALTLVYGKNLDITRSREGIVNALIFMTGMNLYRYQYPVANEECLPYVLEQYPMLGDDVMRQAVEDICIELNPMGNLDASNKLLEMWLRKQQERTGVDTCWLSQVPATDIAKVRERIESADFRD